MTIKLKRLSEKPVLIPKMFEQYKNGGVFNAAAIYLDGNFNFLFRGTDIGGHEDYGIYQNFIGHTKSPNLKDWQHRPNPVLVGEHPFEARGPEDPRVVCIDGTFFMVYTGFGGRYPGDFRICLASSSDLINWEKHGILLDETNKNGSLFPEKIRGKYILLHRRDTGIWISFSEDLKRFYSPVKIMSPIYGEWDEARIGIAGPPVAHPKGWLLFYHGVDRYNVYRLGVALLDRERPWIVLARQKDWVLQPELPREVNGFVPNVVFSCATINWGDYVVVPYACADTVIGVAYIEKNKINFEEGDIIVKNCLM